MSRTLRSPVPDLIFDDEQVARLAQIRPLLAAPGAIDSATPLHRLTLFVTYRCNLACSYCKTIARTPEEARLRPEKTVTYRYADFVRLLDAHAGTPLRHLHLTGGEAALVNDLPAMIAHAKARGVRHVSMTSNGTLPAGRYRALAAAGLDELRISVDASDAALGDALAERAGAWQRTVRTLRDLAGSPDRRFFLIANAVIGMRNRERMAEIVDFLLACGVDDVKLITEVDARGELAAFSGAGAALAAIDSSLNPRAADALPLLRRKARSVFAPDAIGLETAAPAADGAWKCYIPLTERTVDGVAYYPCSVYLREGGAPLGPLTDAPAEQRRKSAAFVERGDCLADPICKRYCLHCTRSYNERANEMRAREAGR